MIKFDVCNQLLTCTNRPAIFSGNENLDKAGFTFDETWDGFVKTAVFTGAETYHVILDDNGVCTVPNEVLADTGEISIGVFGVSGETVKTSSVYVYSIGKGARTTATAIPDPTPDAYAQIIKLIEDGKAGKVDKVEGATEGHLAVFDGDGGIKDGGAVPSGGGSGGGSGEVTANIYTLKYAEPPADPGYWTSATNPELFAALDAIRNDIVAGKDIAVLMDVNPSSGYNHVINASAYLGGGGISVYGSSGYNEIYLTYSIRRPRGADKVYLSKEYTYESDIDNVGTDAKAPTVNFVVDLVKKEISESGESWTGAMTKLASGTIASGTAANTKTDTGVKYSHFKLWHRLVFMRKSSSTQGTFSNGYGYENNAGFRDAHKFLSVVLTHIDGYLWHYRYFATDTVVYSQPTDAVRTGTTETLWSEALGPTSNCDISEGYLDIRIDNKSNGFTDDNTFQIKNWSELAADVSWAIYALTLEG